MDYKFENIKIIDFVKTLTVYKGTSLRKLIAKLAQQKNISDCYSNFYAKLKKETQFCSSFFIFLLYIFTF